MDLKSAQTRRRVITTAIGVGASAAVGGRATDALSAIDDTTTYTRPDPPQVSVTYPSS